MNNSFVTRLLRASMILPAGNFPGTQSNTLVLVNYRMSAHLQGAGNWTNSCDLSIWGMRQVDMNALTVMFGQDGNPQSINARATLVLEAQAGAGWLQVFQGQFNEAQPDYQQIPEVPLVVSAVSGQGAQYLPVPPLSVNGSAQVATLVAQLANQMGLPFENNGVTGSLNTPYFAGTLMDQFRQLCEAAYIDFYFDPKSTLVICPKNKPRQGITAVVLNRDTGLIGYPKLARFGMECDALFQPAFELGAPVNITGSDVPGTNGLWFPFKFDHSLECVKPGGRWQTHLQCMRYPSAQIGSAPQ